MSRFIALEMVKSSATRRNRPTFQTFMLLEIFSMGNWSWLLLPSKRVVCSLRYWWRMLWLDLVIFCYIISLLPILAFVRKWNSRDGLCKRADDRFHSFRVRLLWFVRGRRHCQIRCWWHWSLSFVLDASRGHRPETRWQRRICQVNLRQVVECKSFVIFSFTSSADV